MVSFSVLLSSFSPSPIPSMRHTTRHDDPLMCTLFSTAIDAAAETDSALLSRIKLLKRTQCQTNSERTSNRGDATANKKGGRKCSEYWTSCLAFPFLLRDWEWMHNRPLHSATQNAPWVTYASFHAFKCRLVLTGRGPHLLLIEQ